jgi:sugar lactone lactonase YvrE
MNRKSKSIFTVLVTTVTLLAALVGSKLAPLGIVRADNGGTVFASSSTVPLLQYPEGLTSWQGKVYVATMDFTGPRNHILVFDASTGQLLHTLGDTAPQQDISAGPINGLTIDPSTGDLYAAANGIGYILRIHNPTAPGAHLQVSRYSQYPTGGGPEDMAFDQQGDLYASDSNLGQVYRIPKGGGAPQLVIGPSGSGAPVSDNGLLQAWNNNQPPTVVQGLTPNGMVFSLDYRTLYIANTWADSVVAFDVNSQGQVTGNARIFAQNRNDDLEEYPTGFTGLLRPDTRIGPSASTWLHGPDGLALDSQGDVWVASVLGDNITELDSTGHLIATYGTSAVTAGGLLNQPASLTFVGTSIYATDLSIFTGLAGQPNLPFRVVSFNVGVSGAGGNGNY